MVCSTSCRDCPTCSTSGWRISEIRRPFLRAGVAVSLGQYGDSVRGCWRTEQGLGIGTTLQELEGFNAAPFQIAPLGEWDYAGYVGPWLGGRLANVLDAASGPRIGLRVDFLTQGSLIRAQYDSLSGRNRDSLRSDEPLLRRLHPRVVELFMI